MEVNITLAMPSQLLEILTVRMSSILSDAPSAMPKTAVHEWAYKPKKAELADQIKQGEIWVAESNTGTVLGWARVEGDFLQAIYVSGNYQRQGVGRQLLEFMEAMIAEQGEEGVRLEAALNALTFYRKLGYICTNCTNSEQTNSVSMFKKLL